MPESAKSFSRRSPTSSASIAICSADLTRQNVEVKVQEDFKDLGGDMLDKLDVYIADCDGVVHLAGEMTGSAAQADVHALRAKHPDLVADCRRSARRCATASTSPIRSGRRGSRCIIASCC